MKNICYVLGAGFSAYAGIPIMSNFIDKAKDIYFSDVPCDYKDEIKKTLESIKEYAIIKEYMNCDLSNIEEILSIAEMKIYASKRMSSRNIKEFIKGVIKYYEDITILNSHIKEKSNNVGYEGNYVDQLYANFICSIFQMNVSSTDVIYVPEGIKYKKINISFDEKYKYDIISFNYDTLLEKILEQICKRTEDSVIKFNRGNNESNVRYCKLHGSIDSDNIIPPTWAKTIKSEVRKDWIDAFEILKNANEIRIIGFSFPNTDSHISYLFKSAIIENENLKNIDILCLDNKEDTVKKKYDTIFCTKKYRFLNDDVKNYLRGIVYSKGRDIYKYDQLENDHRIIFSETS